MKDVFVFLAMVAAVAGMMIGGFMASGDQSHGWAGVVGGLAILAATYVVSRPKASNQPTPSETATSTVDTDEPREVDAS